MSIDPNTIDIIVIKEEPSEQQVDSCRNSTVKCEPLDLDPCDESSSNNVNIEDENFSYNINNYIKIEEEKIQEVVEEYENYTGKEKRINSKDFGENLERRWARINGTDVLIDKHLFNINLKPKVLIYKIRECDNIPKIENKTTKKERKTRKHYERLRIKNLQCDFCHKILGRTSLLVHFQRYHGFQARISCSVCKNVFRSQSALISHQTKYRGDCITKFYPVFLKIKNPNPNLKSYTCPECHTAFGSQTSLLSHRLACNVEDYEIFEKVNIKQESLDSKKNLHEKGPIYSTSNEIFSKVSGLFECPECSYKNKRQSHMQRHYLGVHLKERQFKCKHCKRLFSQKIGLERHQQIWHSRKRFICDCCGFRFKLKNTLLRHVTQKVKCNESKTSLDNLSCHICHASFKITRFLKSHMKLHEGIKSEKCQHCKNRFVNTQDLNRHLINHHFSEKLQCNYCSSEFAAKHHYKKHVRNIHKELDKEVLSFLLKKIDDIVVDYGKLKFILKN